MYSKLSNEKSLNLDLETLVQSIAISILSGAKNTIEIWIAYKVWCMPSKRPAQMVAASPNAPE